MVFVTGGTGLVGAKLIIDLIQKGEKVVALKRYQTPIDKFKAIVSCYNVNYNSIETNISWVEGDLLDLERLIQIIPEGSKVYHCAALVSFNPKESEQIININVEGTANLVNACLEKKVVKLCHVSSIGALGGKIFGQKITEETPWSSTNKSAYSISKHYSELEVWRGIAEGLSAVIVNPAVILGSGDWTHGSPQLFTMISKNFKYYTLGTTSYVDVRDVSRAMILLMESEVQGERFLLAAQTLSYKELFEQIAASIGVNAPFKKASKSITALAYLIEKCKSFLLNTEPKITRQTHLISHAYDDYSGEKIQQKLNFSYTSITETIKFIGTCFLEHHKNIRIN